MNYKVDKTTLVERAMFLAMAKHFSTTMKEIGFVGNADKGSVMRLSDYMMSTRGKTVPDNHEYVFIGNASKGEFREYAHVALLINLGNYSGLKDKDGIAYRDLALMPLDLNGKELAYIESDKIKQDREGIVKDAVDPDTKKKEFEITSLDDYAEHIEKGKNICPKTKKEVIKRTKEAGGKVEQEKLSSQDELEEELKKQQEGKEILDFAGVELTDELKSQLQQKGISLSDVKQVTTVKTPEALAEHMGEEGNISEKGEVAIISLQNHEANAKGDRMVTIQNGMVNDKRTNDSKLRDFKEKHGKDSEIISKTYPEEEQIEYVSEGTRKQETVIGVEQKTMEDVEQKLLRIQLDTERKINDIEKDNTIDPIEKQKQIAEARAEAYVKVEELQRTTGVIMPGVSETYLAEADKAAEREEESRAVEEAREEGEGEEEREILTPADAATKRRFGIY